MSTDPIPTTGRRGSVRDLREKDPKGPGQFETILATSTQTTATPPREQPASERPSESVPGFGKADVSLLEEREKRYAAARRAATVGGRDSLYE